MEFLLDRKSIAIELDEVQSDQTISQMVEVNKQWKLTITQPPKRSKHVKKQSERFGFLHETGQSDTDRRPTKMLCQTQIRVWTLVDPLEGIVPVGCKWIYNGVNGEMTTYKARLGAKGYTQRPGVDFEETFSPVAMPKSITIMLAIAAYYDYEIWQIDVKTAFLKQHWQRYLYGATRRLDI